MTNTSRLRALFFSLCCGAPLAASCAHDGTPDLEGSGAGKNGGSKTAGNHSGGSSVVAGTTNGFGGTNAQGGKVNGGNSSGGTTAEPEAGAPSSGGTTSSGGSGGTNSVPPDVLARAKAIVYYRTNETMDSSQKISMKLNIVNQSPDPLPMAHVKIRYWATAEKQPDIHNYYLVESFKPVKSEYVEDGDDSHALMSFVGAPGTISMSETDINKSEIQLELSTNSGTFDQSDDYSFDATATTAPKPNPKITLYLDDELIWGCEPSGKCFDDGGAGGAGGMGAGGEGGAGGSSATAGTGGTGGTGGTAGTAGSGGTAGTDGETPLGGAGAASTP